MVIVSGERRFAASVLGVALTVTARFCVVLVGLIIWIVCLDDLQIPIIPINILLFRIVFGPLLFNLFVFYTFLLERLVVQITLVNSLDFLWLLVEVDDLRKSFASFLFKLDLQQLLLLLDVILGQLFHAILLIEDPLLFLCIPLAVIIMKLIVVVEEFGQVVVGFAIESRQG